MTEHLDLGGVVVATALPYREDSGAPAGLAVDYERYAEHCRWLIDNGCRGVGPNGSLGEYSSLTDEERRRVVQVAVEAVGDRGIVIAGVHAPGWHQAQHWARLAKEDGADGVLCLPPTMYRSAPDDIVTHYEKVAEIGLPIMIYNNPFDTKVDLTPDLVARIARIPKVVAVKEFSGDVRRAFEIEEQCAAAGTTIDVIAGADDVLFELMVDGATGWFAGYPNVFPREAVAIYDAMVEGRYDEARDIYRRLIGAFRWDSRPEFVQAIKLGMDMAGRYGGPCRPPRAALSEPMAAQIREETQRALDAVAELSVRSV
ncbi:dihydrodipicolinate synthase family protein [Pseudoclavibacter chungangensis]|uniref:Dihydrodipicolinate synthase family protein n=1 Tax=Pseudoclavibacter chungangensis TaxID=587635 RepID=A0A7J5C220_9MICO|nr:dihydrodipicolinate synthase family protein [Pseudoclavibacter chungangensis]KAB1662220.1 dihydrodipicolinate synthase family protein [Pseudoclavibacter chungangensis]NYJ65421.1 4-hydroxy-tetrahydrodipicolinate synthase [Pseudoclavibacter chungangensis]